MSLSNTPQSERTHISLFGKRNVGKSSLINALTDQDTAIVSKVKGTTTDPVTKSMEILPIGPCVITDTAGIDDEGSLGKLRINKTLEVLNKTDLALIVIDAMSLLAQEDIELVNTIKEKNIPLVVAVNKIDTVSSIDKQLEDIKSKVNCPVAAVSAYTKKGIDILKNKIIKVLPQDDDKIKIIGDLISPSDIVVLVTPIDKAAPKGRLILPQQQTVRDILDNNAISVVTKEFQLKDTLNSLSKKPKLVVTDSQAFAKVSAITPKNILLTSFSILFARYKGNLSQLVKGAKAVSNLKDGDKVLIAEACTHHRQSDDIGTVKIPRWIKQKTGKNITFEFAHGNSFTEDIKKYSLIVHCGGCMLNRAAMLNRIETAEAFNVPIVNYGILIAYVLDILPRALEPFPNIKAEFEKDE